MLCIVTATNTLILIYVCHMGMCSMNHTTLALVVVLAAAVVVGLFGAQLVQPVSAEQCASSASSVSGTAATTAEAEREDNNHSCSTIAEASPPED
jgi:hypothetical protein